MNTTTQLLTRTEVEAAVRGYWDSSTRKAADEQAAWYDEHAIIFASSSKRPELAKIVLLRRKREYLSSGTEMQAQIGNIEVEILGPDHAIAAYTIELKAHHVAKPSASGQKVTEEHLQNARVTHVFVRGSDGKLRIIHEHISVPAD
jgi:ketosteroid isomerase-like protein